MKDFPCFATDDGVASLILKEIPYRQEAYIRFQDVQPGRFAPFCRSAFPSPHGGSGEDICSGHEELSQYPLHAAVYEMRGKAWVDTKLLENIFPVTEATAETWRKLCNERMRGVDCAATQTAGDEKEILESGGAYFVHSAGELLGIGWMKDTELLAVCSVKPGAGERVMHTLMSLVEGAGMTLEVASTNAKATRLYEKLGLSAHGGESAPGTVSGRNHAASVDTGDKICYRILGSI